MRTSSLAFYPQKMSARSGGERLPLRRGHRVSYHEDVARAMKQTWSAGMLNTYEEILAKLHERFPTEEALRAYVAKMEAEAVRLGWASPG